MQFRQKINSVIRNSCALNVSCGDELCKEKERPDNLANGLLQQWGRPHSLSPSLLSDPSILSQCVSSLLSQLSPHSPLLSSPVWTECLKTSGPLLRYNINSVHFLPYLPPSLTLLIAAPGTHYCFWQGEVMTKYRYIYRYLYMYIKIYTGPRWLTVGG